MVTIDFKRIIDFSRSQYDQPNTVYYLSWKPFFERECVEGGSKTRVIINKSSSHLAPAVAVAHAVPAVSSYSTHVNHAALGIFIDPLLSKTHF